MKAESPDRFSLACANGVIATMHGKERVIGPLLRTGLGIHMDAVMDLDTDRFGTFSREVERLGRPLDAARAKLAAVMDRDPGVRVGVASEGSFGPHPVIPFVPWGRELVLLADRHTGLELAGYDDSTATNFAHRVAADAGEVAAFAADIGFPDHGIIVMGCRDGQPAPGLALLKELRTLDALLREAECVIRRCGAVFLETDMRAHRNPTRMEAIGRATQDLVRRFFSRCPDCGWPGYDVSEWLPGLPCESCGLPTRLTRTEILTCLHCPCRQPRPVAESAADPSRCDFCNP